MVAHSEQTYSPYSPAQLFALVADIESYPEFLPWCSAARIVSKEGNIWLADLVIHFKSFHEKYTSRVRLDEQGGAIIVEMVSGPFSHLHNCWKFTAAPEGGSFIDFELDFKFRSIILEKLIGFMFEKAFTKMAEAFTRRAEVIYGTGNSIVVTP
jgi:coenzyme Q-binding protein COQ10